MSYYEMVARAVLLSFGIAGLISLWFNFLGSVYVEETKQEWARKILRASNIELHVLAGIAVFVLTEGSPAGIKASLLWGVMACIAIDQLVCKNSRVYKWMVPKRKEDEEDEV